jgi:protein-disulfide isomerase
MSSRAEQKQRLKEERLKAEQAERAAATRKRRLGILGGVAGIALIAVVAALVITGGNKDEVAPASNTADLFEGIPQKGLTIGNPDAPVEVEEFLDLQCPVCKAFSENGLDVLINDYVRTGKVKLTMRPIAILGQDSQRAAETVLSASRQDLAWNFAETFYANQGPENSGYVTDSFLDDVAKQTKGLDAQRTLSGRNANEVKSAYDATAQRMQELGVNSTPSFFATVGKGKPQPLNISANDPASVTAALDPITQGAN